MSFLQAERQERLMLKFDDINRDRRKVIAAGAALLGTALWPASLRAENNSRSKIPIGTIGAGHIGGTIGGLWVKNGHEVSFSSRHPEELKDLVASLGPLAQAGTVAQAIAFGEAVLISVPYGALPQIGRDYAAALKGKIVLDTCNAVAARDGTIADEVQANGIGVTSQKYLAGTRLVRAFNTMSYKIFASQANRPNPKLAVPIAGDDPEAVQVAADLVRDAGFDPVIVGKLVDAKLFQRGGPGYGQLVSAVELRRKLSLQ
jgi:predicted dinucleotide-binding enzyme